MPLTAAAGIADATIESHSDFGARRLYYVEPVATRCAACAILLGTRGRNGRDTARPTLHLRSRSLAGEHGRRRSSEVSPSAKTTFPPPGTTSSPTCRSRPPPPLHPGTGQPIGPADLAPLFPMALIEQEVSSERWIEIPDEVREVYRLWRPSPLLPRPPPGAGARDAGAHLLQVRGRQPGRLPQAEHRRGPGLLQQAGGHPPPGHRDRRRPVGLVAGLRLRAVRPGVHRLHGEGLAIEQKPYRRIDDADLGAEVIAQPHRPDATPAAQILAEDPDSPASWASPSPRRWRTRRPTTTPTTPWAAC